MIPARRWPGFARWFGRRATARVRRDFDRVMIDGLADARTAADSAPTLWVANHVSWWDPMVTLMLADQLAIETFAMMEAANLERLPFLGLAGGFGVRRGDRRDGADAIRHTLTLLDRPRRAVWVFPQGRTVREAEPLAFEPGATAIAARAPAAVIIPVGLRYRFGDTPRPELWIALGPPLRGIPSGLEGTRTLTQAVADCLDRIDRAPDRFAPLWPVGPGALDWPTRWLAAFSSWVTRRFGPRLEASVAIGEPVALASVDGTSQGGDDPRRA